MVAISFVTTSTNACQAVKSAGGAAVDCNHGAGHCALPAALATAQ